MRIRSTASISIFFLGSVLALAGCDRKDAAKSEPAASSSSTALTNAAVANPAAPKLSAACVDAVADARQRAKAKDMSEDVIDAIASTPAPDLDGDGTPDVAVGYGLGTVEGLSLYVTHGKCAQFVGELNVASVSALPTKSAGLSDLVGDDASLCEGSRAPCKPTKRTYRFDGAAYREAPGGAKAAAVKPSVGAAPAKKPVGTGAATKCGANQHFDAITKVCRALGDCPKGYRWNEPMQSCVDDGG